MKQPMSLHSKLRVVKQQKKSAVYGYWARLQKELIELRQESTELELRASKNPVTGLDNRESIADQYRDLIATRQKDIYNNRRQKEEGYVAVIFGDVDHFKSVNDTYGHDVGDIALRLVGAKLTETARDGDIPFHLSGDEFGIVLPNVGSLEDAVIAAERARHEIANSSFDADGNQIKLSMSLGVKLVDPKTEVVFSDILKKADKAAYRSKELGRNRVTAMHANGNLIESDGEVKAQKATQGASEVPEHKSVGLSFEEELLTEGNMRAQFSAAKKEITERKLLNEALAHGVRHDQMTGLLNRTGANERYKRLQSKIVRKTKNVNSKNIATLLIDINNFKNVNDRYGHHVGDEILKDTAKIIKNSIRDMDVDCRWGGEEFVVAFESGGRTGALRIAKRIEEGFDKYSYEVGEDVIRPKVSIGIALHKPSDEAKTLEEAVKPADQAMYEAKALAKKNEGCTVIGFCNKSEKTVFYGRALKTKAVSTVDLKSLSVQNKGNRFKKGYRPSNIALS